MKWFQGAVLLAIISCFLAGCSGGKEAPVVDSSSPQAVGDRVKQIQNDPNMPANEKQAIIAGLNHNPGGEASHVPSGVSTAK